MCVNNFIFLKFTCLKINIFNFLYLENLPTQKYSLVIVKKIKIKKNYFVKNNIQLPSEWELEDQVP